MKKHYLFIIFVFVAFSATVFAQEAAGSASAEAPAASTSKAKFLSFILGSGMDYRYSNDGNRVYSVTESALAADPQYLDSFLQGPLGMNAYFSAGVRLLGFLDIYGRAGFGWTMVYEDLRGSTYDLFVNIYDVNLDANVRGSVMFADIIGVYAHFNAGMALHLLKAGLLVGSWETGKEAPTRSVAKNEMMTGYLNTGAGFLFQTGKNSTFSFGYNLYYSFTPIFTEAYLVPAYEGTKLVFIGDNLLSHGINFEYQYLF